MKEIFISEKEMPKSCCKCPCYSGEHGNCKVNGKSYIGNYAPKKCPLQSIEQHDNKVRRKFAEEAKAEMEKEKVSYSADYICGVQHCQIVVDDLLRQYEVEE